MFAFWKLAKRPDEDAVRNAIFLPNTTDLRALGAPRKVGRPRMEWATSILKALQTIVPDPCDLQSLLGRAVKLSVFNEAICKHFAVFRTCIFTALITVAYAWFHTCSFKSIFKC